MKNSGGGGDPMDHLPGPKYGGGGIYSPHPPGIYACANSPGVKGLPNGDYQMWPNLTNIM